MLLLILVSYLIHGYGKTSQARYQELLVVFGYRGCNTELIASASRYGHLPDDPSGRGSTIYRGITIFAPGDQRIPPGYEPAYIEGILKLF